MGTARSLHPPADEALPPALQADDYRRSDIYMTAVDTGWINDENPAERAARIAAEHNFQTPIDEVDAAARVLDPIICGVAEGKLLCGVFLKDYAETEW